MIVETFRETFGLVNEVDDGLSTIREFNTSIIDLDTETTFFETISDGIEDSLEMAAIGAAVEIIISEAPNILSYIGHKLIQIGSINSK